MLKIQWKTSKVSVVCDGENVGKSNDLDEPNGSVAIGIDIDEDAAKAKIAEILEQH